MREFDENRYVFMATQNGIVKKCSLDVFSRPYSAGIIAINLDEGDKLIEAQLTEGDHHIVLVTKSGLSIRFNEAEVRSMGRTAAGGAGGFVWPMMILLLEWCLLRMKRLTLLVVTENGYGKRTSLKEYRLQGRAGKGVIAIKTSSRNGTVVAVKMVSNDDELIFISSNGMVTRIPVSDIRTIGRNTQGVRLMALRPDEIVVDVGKISGNESDAQG